MIRRLVFLAATTALAGCAANTPRPRVVPPPVVVDRPGRSAGSARAQARYGIFGFDTAGMDTSVLPGNNFYQLPTAPG